MSVSILLPFEVIQPSEILSEHAEWVYFFLVLIFFVSIAGVTLRRHFSKPYVKPLVISVGLMLTVGVFQVRDLLVSIFEGWGALGSILLLIMAAFIPYGLCRGFGMQSRRAVYVTYTLLYILSWVKFPEIYHALANKNLGLLNLALLILFFVAAYKSVRLPKSVRDLASGVETASSPFEPEIEREIDVQKKEQWLIKKRGLKNTKLEIKTIDDIEKALSEIQSIVDQHRNNIPREERERMAVILGEMAKKEDVFVRSIQHVQEIIRRSGTLDEAQIEALRDRVTRVSGKEQEMIYAEIAREEEKLKIESAALALGQRLRRDLDAFNGFVTRAMECVRAAPYPYDAKPHLSSAESVLNCISKTLKTVKSLERKLLRLTSAERNLLKKERQKV
ncbi:MAG: hypothetical protein SWH78_16820 [Thermodesulfobacteriota bacterium]|nr:hypothetical protein [Thermodesulfobacteriota bacterium]